MTWQFADYSIPQNKIVAKLHRYLLDGTGDGQSSGVFIGNYGDTLLFPRLAI
jgi:hypothetical protein